MSRSSALASKATGYPIAKVAAKIALGYTLDEIRNAITGKTYASFEPMLDYCVVKMPRLPFDKFITARRSLSTQMKATGEVMSICTNFEGALMKAIRSLEQHVDSLMSYDFSGLDDEQLHKKLQDVDDQRIWVIAEALRRGFTREGIYKATKIDPWFLDKIAHLTEMEKALKEQPLTEDLLREAKRMEFPDSVIASLTGKTQEEIRLLREKAGIHASFRMVDTCAAEFEAQTPYYYSVYDGFISSTLFRHPYSIFCKINSWSIYVIPHQYSVTFRPFVVSPAVIRFVLTLFWHLFVAFNPFHHLFSFIHSIWGFQCKSHWN